MEGALGNGIIVGVGCVEVIHMVSGCARGEMEVGCGSRDEIGGVDDHEATRRLMVTFVVLPEDRWG